MNLNISMILLIMVSAVILPSELDAAEIEGAIFKDSITIENKALNLTGLGLLSYWGFKAYVGAFYLEEGNNFEDALLDRVKRIEIEYLRPIKGNDFGPATDKGIAKNVDSKTLNRLRPLVDYQNSLYEDVQPGGRYSLTYLPGKGTELALNGEPKGLI